MGVPNAHPASKALTAFSKAGVNVAVFVSQVGRAYALSMLSLCRVSLDSSFLFLSEPFFLDICTAFDHTSTLLQIFESTANAAAQAALHYWSELYEALHVSYNTIWNEGADALKGIVFQDPNVLAQIKVILDMFDNPEPSIAQPSAKGPTPLPVTHSKSGPSQSSKSAQHIEETLQSGDEESDSDSHSSVIGSLLEPSGHDSDSDQNLSAPIPDPDALEDELAGDMDLADKKALAVLSDEFCVTQEELHDMNQDLEAELWVANSPWHTHKKKLPKKCHSAARL
ncbi:hypothetical protein EDD85DRAFT_963081 [Armillaria nabsnona]|nr:hypothetical protein EDD85DRAFT_963081 [Armillaria nabsnona]